MGTLLVRGITFEGQHGATAAERSLAWRFEVDVELEADLARAEQSDALADTHDYASICRTVVEIGTRRTFHLLEALGRALLDELAQRHPGTAVRVEVRKLAPPHCLGRPAYTAVRLARPAAPAQPE